MDEIVAQVSERTGLSEEHARVAVTLVVEWVKGKLPETMRGQVDTFLGGADEASGRSLASAAAGAFGGLLGGD